MGVLVIHAGGGWGHHSGDGQSHHSYGGFPSGVWEGLFRKLIKPLSCEVREAVTTVVHPVHYTQLCTAWQSDYAHAHLLDVIRQLLFHGVNTRTSFKTANYST